jgi:hypothetical protein
MNQARLKALLSYNPRTGLLIWRERPIRKRFLRVDRTWNAAWAGRMAGTPRSDGYIQVAFGYGRYCRAHQLVWLYMTGEWPRRRMDHINLKRDDNRWCNLRLASDSQSINHQRRRKDNTSGHKGLVKLPSGRWRVRVAQEHIGCFVRKRDAIAAYRKEALKRFGEFAHF